ncbi:MAG: hypothetical protein IH851_13320 [Armatimonadetes bacterium]|nr:hypothetical protein [Armatimonadota bacterium]
MRGEDPRDQAATWLAKVAGEEKSIGFVTDPWFYSPPLFPDTGLFRLRLDDGTLLFGGDSRVYAMRRFNPNLIRYGPAEGLRREWDQRLLREMAPDYVVFSSFEFIDHDRVNDAEIERFIERLVSEYDLAAVFWGRVPVLLDQESMGDDGLTRRALRQTFSTRYPLLHDLMYIQPTICVFQRKPTN